MGNCLVTKLKGSVDNDDLLKLGEGVFIHEAEGYNENRWFKIFAETETTKKAVSDATLYGAGQSNLGQQVTLSQSEIYLHMATLGQKTKVENMYNVTVFALLGGITYRGANPTFFPNLKQFWVYLNIPFILKNVSCKSSLQILRSLIGNLIEEQGETLDFSQFSALVSFELLDYRGEPIILSPVAQSLRLSPASGMTAATFSSLGIQGGTTTLKHLSLEYIPLTDSNFSAFLPFVELEDIAFNGIKGLSGDLSVLGGLTHLTKIGFPNTQNVDCVLEDLVGHARTAGRTTGSITCAWAGASNTTFQGNHMVNKASAILSWTATTITYDGVTIDA